MRQQMSLRGRRLLPISFSILRIDTNPIEALLALTHLFLLFIGGEPHGGIVVEHSHGLLDFATKAIKNNSPVWKVKKRLCEVFSLAQSLRNLLLLILHLTLKEVFPWDHK